MLSALTGVVDSRIARKELKKRTASFVTDLSVSLPPILLSLFLALTLYVDADRKEEAALMSLVLLNHWIYKEKGGEWRCGEGRTEEACRSDVLFVP